MKVLSDDAEGAVFNSSYPMFGVDIRNQQGFKTYKIHIANITESEPPTQPTTGYYIREFTLATIPHGLGKVPTYYAFWNIKDTDIILRTRARFDVEKTLDWGAGDYPATYNALLNGNTGFFTDIYHKPHYGKYENVVAGFNYGKGRYTTPFTQICANHDTNDTTTYQPVDSNNMEGLIYLEADNNNIYVKMKLPYWVNQNWNDSWNIPERDIFYVYSGLAKEWVSLVGSTITLTLFITPY